MTDLFEPDDLRGARALANHTLTGHATVTRRTGETAGRWGETIPSYATVYDGRALTQTGTARSAAGGATDSAGLAIPLAYTVGKAPWGTDIRRGDLWTAEGRTWTVTATETNTVGILVRVDLAANDDQEVTRDG